MQSKTILLISLAFILLTIMPIMAKGMLDLEPTQIDKTQLLDKEYIVKSSGVYFKDLKQDNPIVWIDKKVGTTYHVDSTKTFDKEENESVTLEFFYDIQPDYIAHYTHSGLFDRYYFPTQWEWVSNCDGEVCNGGWVTIEVKNIEKGTGSSTFPIGVTGPTWANDGQFFGEFDGESSFVEVANDNSLNNSENFTVTFWIKKTSTINNDIINKWEITGNERGWGVSTVSITGGCGPRLVISHNGSSSNATNTAVPTTFNICDGNWHFLALGYNSTDLIVNYDDLEVDTKSVNKGLFLGISPIKISDVDITAKRLNGSIDEVLIYNRSLSQADITELFNQYTEISTGINRTGTINTTGLVLDINFDDFSVADNSGQGNHGTNTNVSFGEVFSIKNLLTEGIDYSIVGAAFTLLNDNLQWAGIDIDWVYDQNNQTSATGILRLTGVFIALVLVIVLMIPIFNFIRKNR